MTAGGAIFQLLVWEKEGSECNVCFSRDIKMLAELGAGSPQL
jgi:hypothetical protein